MVQSRDRFVRSAVHSETTSPLPICVTFQTLTAHSITLSQSKRQWSGHRSIVTFSGPRRRQLPELYVLAERRVVSLDTVIDDEH